MKEREEAERIRKEKAAVDQPESATSPSKLTPVASPATSQAAISPPLADIRTTLGGIGSGIGSFFGSKVASLRGTTPVASTGSEAGVSPVATPEKRGLRPMSLTPSASTNVGKGRSPSGTGQSS